MCFAVTAGDQRLTSRLMRSRRAFSREGFSGRSEGHRPRHPRPAFGRALLTNHLFRELFAIRSAETKLRGDLVNSAAVELILPPEASPRMIACLGLPGNVPLERPQQIGRKPRYLPQLIGQSVPALLFIWAQFGDLFRRTPLEVELVKLSLLGFAQSCRKTFDASICVDNVSMGEKIDARRQIVIQDADDEAVIARTNLGESFSFFRIAVDPRSRATTRSTECFERQSDPTAFTRIVPKDVLIIEIGPLLHQVVLLEASWKCRGSGSRAKLGAENAADGFRACGLWIRLFSDPDVEFRDLLGRHPQHDALHLSAGRGAASAAPFRGIRYRPHHDLRIPRNRSGRNGVEAPLRP